MKYLGSGSNSQHPEKQTERSTPQTYYYPEELETLHGELVSPEERHISPIAASERPSKTGKGKGKKTNIQINNTYNVYAPSNSHNSTSSSTTTSHCDCPGKHQSGLQHICDIWPTPEHMREYYRRKNQDQDQYSDYNAGQLDPEDEGEDYSEPSKRTPSKLVLGLIVLAILIGGILLLAQPESSESEEEPRQQSSTTQNCHRDTREKLNTQHPDNDLRPAARFEAGDRVSYIGPASRERVGNNVLLLRNGDAGVIESASANNSWSVRFDNGYIWDGIAGTDLRLNESRATERRSF